METNMNLPEVHTTTIEKACIIWPEMLCSEDAVSGGDERPDSWKDRDDLPKGGAFITFIDDNDEHLTIMVKELHIMRTS